MHPHRHAERPYRGWIPQAQVCLSEHRSPEEIGWNAAGVCERNLFAAEAERTGAGRGPWAPAFVRRARKVACHRSAQRWDVLYRALWRIEIRHETHLFNRAGDPDVRRLEDLHRAVAMDIHHMIAFLRFGDIDGEAFGGIRLLARYEPDHAILGWVVPHFMRRLGETSWAILTPQASVTCRNGVCDFGPGWRVTPKQTEDDLATLWRRYYQATYNSERSNPPLFDKSLPLRYRQHLTEASTIEQLTQTAGAAPKARRIARREVVGRFDMLGIETEERIVDA
jgi:DNA polymerase